MRAAGATVYVVGIGGVAGISIKGERLLRQLAVESGGRFFFPSRDEQLAEVHDTLTDDVQNRYLITYTPEEPEDRRDVAGDHRARPAIPTTSSARAPGTSRPSRRRSGRAVEFTVTEPGGGYLDVSATISR